MLKIILASVLIILSLLTISNVGESMIFLEGKKYFYAPKEAEFVDSVQNGDIDRVREGIKSGINVNIKGNHDFRPIHFVFSANSADVLKLLLAAGADSNARIANGNTVLHFAVRMPNPEFTHVLLTYGANPNSCGENEKPVIHEALTSHQPEILKTLVKAGANIDVVWGGTTPLLASMKMFLWGMASVLLELKADMNFRDNTGKNAIERFCFQIKKVPPTQDNRKGIPHLAEILKRRGGVIPCEADLVKFRQ